MTDSKATIVGGATIETIADGPCLTGTLDQLRACVSAKPMPEAALTKVRKDALGLLGAVVSTYATEVCRRLVAKAS